MHVISIKVKGRGTVTYYFSQFLWEHVILTAYIHHKWSHRYIYLYLYCLSKNIYIWKHLALLFTYMYRKQNAKRLQSGTRWRTINGEKLRGKGQGSSKEEITVILGARCHDLELKRIHEKNHVNTLTKKIIFFFSPPT
jgi:hypothetical protein